ncbi:MAG: cation:proton antiporter, partial [Pseudomonadota bacterium]
MALKILIVGLTIFLAHFFVFVFRKTKIPDVLLLMIGGIAVGPVLKLIGPEDFGVVGPVVTSIALIVILFEGGVNLHLRTVFGALRHTVFITLITWAATAATAAYLMYSLTPLGWSMAIMTGAIVGGTSSAVVVPMISALGMDERPRTVLFLESAITDVLCIVVTMGLLQALERGDLDAGPMLLHILLSFGAATVIGTAGGLAWALLLGLVRRFPNTIFSTVACVFLLYGVTELFEFSGAIAALAFGLSLANFSGLSLSLTLSSKVKKTLKFRKVSRVDKLFFSEMVFLLKTFFFIYMGICMRFDRAVYFVLGFVIVALVYLERFIIVRLVAYRQFTRRDASIMTIMVPKGLAAAVLAFLPAQQGLAGAEWVEGVVIPVVLISIVATSVLMVLIEKTPLRKMYFKIFASFATVEGAAPAPPAATEPIAHTITETSAHPQP